MDIQSSDLWPLAYPNLEHYDLKFFWKGTTSCATPSRSQSHPSAWAWCESLALALRGFPLQDATANPSQIRNNCRGFLYYFEWITWTNHTFSLSYPHWSLFTFFSSRSFSSSSPLLIHLLLCVSFRGPKVIWISLTTHHLLLDFYPRFFTLGVGGQWDPDYFGVLTPFHITTL